MSREKFSDSLKKARISAKKSVADVSKYLISCGYKASEKTIYSWESGRSQPTPDAFLEMCVFYNVENVLYSFGYESSLPERSHGDDGLSDIADIYQNLNTSGRTSLVRQAKFLSQQEDCTDDKKTVPENTAAV